MREPGRTAVPAGGGDRWRLDGRIALVTGASTGLGARFARVLHQAGGSVEGLSPAQAMALGGIVS